MRRIVARFAQEQSMTDRSVTLPMVDAYMEEKHDRLAFPPALEQLYADRMSSYRRKATAKGVLPAIIIYNAFLIADLLLVPATIFLSSVLHLAVVTPIILLSALVVSKAKHQRTCEIAAAVVPFAMVAQIMFIYAVDKGTAADQYQYLAIIVVIYMNVNQRFGHRVAFLSTIMLAATYAAVLLTAHSSIDVQLTGICMMVSGGYISLMANRRMEQDARFNFLSRLREELRRERAEEVAKRDALTGLENRRKLDEVVDVIWSTAEERDSLIAVIMVDIDHFKPFNDRYGHAAGDVCLKRVAGAIAAELRDARDLAVRMGGEEFLLLFPSTDMSEAVRIAERVRRQIEDVAIPHEEFGPRAVVTASLGVAAGPVSCHSFTELLAAADSALYAAKRNGRNQVWPPFVSKNTEVDRLAEKPANPAQTLRRVPRDRARHQ
jgi:diguanylate cyclase (GGDEF)-like protein